MKSYTSFWFKPTGKIASDLEEQIAKLSQKYNFPKFPPHITLLGDIDFPVDEIIKKAEELAGTTSSFKVKLEDFGFDESYFKCLYINISENPELQSINKKAQTLFGRNENFAPHISIMYGENVAEDVKHEILKSEIIAHFKGEEFLVDTLFVKSGGPDPSVWKEIASFPLLSD